MEMNPANIFVIGDLVIDHTLFVRTPSGPHQQMADEQIYEVIRRQDVAGGAANTARILASFNSGATFLWGLTGGSNWGTFRAILEHSQAIDGASANIEFRGVQDETSAQMNTITRLMATVTPSIYESLVPKARFDDYGHVHVSDSKRQTVLHHLERAHEKNSLQAIIINDLDMGALTRDLVTKIADFAHKHAIDLFVDPKRQGDKYSAIEGTAILPNLAEWCHLVGEGNAAATWRNKIQHPAGLVELAQLSFRELGNFRYHIIKCDSLGAIILAPHPKRDDRYAVYQIDPHPIRTYGAAPQLGCGDVMTGIVALEFCTSRKTSEDFLRAFLKANVVVACYRDMPWQRMPNPQVAATKPTRSPADIQPVVEPSKGMLFLPKDKKILLWEHETSCPGLFSDDPAYRQAIDEIIEEVARESKIGIRSIIVGAPAGSGKSTLIEALQGDLGTRLGVAAIQLGVRDINWEDPIAAAQELATRKGGKSDKLLIIVDEALKGEMGQKLRQLGVLLLNAAHLNSIRFLFIDALFKPVMEEPVSSEFTSRCRSYYLPGLAERPIDIPYIVASVVFKRDPTTHLFKVQGKFLLAITNAALLQPNVRVLCEWAEDSHARATTRCSAAKHLSLNVEDLPSSVRSQRQPDDLATEEYAFHRWR